MILRRIATALKRQDWTTVGIEFLLVVAGVLFALQVNNWAQEADERKAERAALERLFLEAQNAYEVISMRVERSKRFNQVRRNGVAFVDSDDPLPENTLPLKIGINALAQFPVLSFSSIAYDDLKSSGQVRIIQSAEIRDIVSLFYVEVDRLNQLQDIFRDGGNEYWAAYRRNIIWRYNAEAPGSDILISTYDWDAMRQDRDFITIAIGNLRNQIVIEDSLVSLEETAKTMCDVLGNALDRSCSEIETQGKKPGEQE